MNHWLRRRAIGLACNAGVVLTYSGILLGAGHGVAPIGLLLILGRAEEWAPPMAFGQVAVALLAIAVLLPGRFAYAISVLIGVILLIVSWVLFISLSEVVPISLLFSVPFVAAAVGRIIYLHFETRAARATN